MSGYCLHPSLPRAVPDSKDASVPKRLTTLLLCLAALVAGVLSVATPASAATPPTVRIVGAAHPGTTADAPVMISYTITVTGKIANVQLDTGVFDSAPVDVSGVQVNGTTVPSGTVSVSGRTMTIRLGFGADSVNGGYLADQTVVVTYPQLHPTDAGKYPTTSGSLYFNVDGNYSSVNSAVLVLADPDLVVTAPDESGVAPLGTGRTAGFGAVIANPGATSTTTTVHVTLPAGLRVDPQYGVLRYNDETGNGIRLSCSGPARALSCAFGEVAHGAHEQVIVPVQATSAAKIGSIGSFSVSAVPTGRADQDLSNNTVSARVRYTGIAVLHFALTPAARKVKVGSTDRIRLSVRNDGPQPAVLTLGLAVVQPQHFTITGYSTNRNVPGPDMFRIEIGSTLGGVIAWNAGTIAAHRTVTAQVTVKAVSAGAAQILFYGDSEAANPSCDGQTPRCATLATVTLTAVK